MLKTGPAFHKKNDSVLSNFEELVQKIEKHEFSMT